MYLGIFCTLSNLMLAAGLVTIHLSYFYFKASHVARVVQDFAARRGTLNKTEYLLQYRATVSEVIQFQNEVEQTNMRLRNWLIFVYFGVSFAANFGFYLATLVHIDNGVLDVSFLTVCVIALTTIGGSSYTNGIILTKVKNPS